MSRVFFLYCLSCYFDILRHNSDRYADALMRMLMRCHLPSAYDSLGRFSIENLYLSYQSMIIVLKLFSYDSRAYRGSLFACDARELPILICLYFHTVVATQCITFDAYAGIARMLLM